jgi:voltage-gated potassium channel
MIYPLNFIFNFRHNENLILVLRTVDVVFIVDIIFSAWKYYSGTNEFIFEQGTGIRKYLSTWFIIDFISIIPIVFISDNSIWEMIRLVKFFKLIQLMKLYKNREIRIAGLLSFLYFGFWFIQISHWLACGWLFFKGYETNISHSDNYVRALYWTITTITTIGYGDIVPSTTAQMIYVMAVEIIGVAMYGFVIGNVANILSKKDPSKQQYQNNLDSLTSLIKLRKLPVELQKRLRDYYTYIYYQKFGYDEVNFINHLPKSLASEVSYYIKKDLISRIPIFSGASREFVEEISLHLKPIVVVPNSFVFKEGDNAEEMYFVVSGKLKVIIDADMKEIAELNDGDFFGEIAIFENIKRTASVKAITYCDLYILTKQQYSKVAVKYPEIARLIEAEAKIRKEKL